MIDIELSIPLPCYSIPVSRNNRMSLRISR